ncbi:MAG: hypothetical protein J5933_01100 [Clostridia bacterium]|nr:hypothetical protein [Clostridia bacterium]
MNIKIDSYFGIPDPEDEEIILCDIRRAPFRIYGLYDVCRRNDFVRLPEEVARTVSPSVEYLARNTAGGRLRFSTDSSVVVLRAKMASTYGGVNFSPLGSSGFDLYVDDENSRSESRFYRPFRFELDSIADYRSVVEFRDRRQRYLTINFPSYAEVEMLSIGLESGASVGPGKEYADMDPIVYYGSSITQGGCSSRPGNTYPNIVCRHTEIDYINLGFSGAGKGEKEIVDYMKGLRMSVFVSDYDHNAPNPEHLRNTHEPLYREIRSVHPEIPYIFMSLPDAYAGSLSRLNSRRDVIYETFMKARADGDENVYFIDGESLFRGPYEDICYADSTHPTDMGFAFMADAVTSVVKKALFRDRIEK